MTNEQCQLQAVPYQGNGEYDPNWISCFLNNGECFCFHPNQGHGNTVPTGCEKVGCETVAQVKAAGITELPKTGAGSVGLAIVVTLILIGGLWMLFRFLHS